MGQHLGCARGAQRVRVQEDEVGIKALGDASDAGLRAEQGKRGGCMSVQEDIKIRGCRQGDGRCRGLQVLKCAHIV